MKAMVFAWALNFVIGLTLLAGPTAADAQAKAQAAMRVKSWNSVVLFRLRDAKGEQIPFDYSAGVAILSNGSVLFGDQYEPRIVLADSTGRFVAAAGRKGGGPGEFEARSRVLRLRGDSIGVHDGMLRRLSIFDSKLTFARTELIQEFSRTRGFNSVQGQFADGSMVMLHRPMMSFSSANVVREVQYILYVSDRGGKFTQFNLPLSRELQVSAGNRGTAIKVPMTSISGVAVCENGFVTIADGRIEVHDASFRLLLTTPYRGRIDTLSSAERTQLIQVHSGGYENTTFQRKIEEALDAEQPRRLVRYSTPFVSADGMLWFRAGDDAEGRFMRTTLRGEIIDTLYAP
ncbi:hypothetical protein [Gemmatimonas groenlandica]|uniref:6-bladed beta-propeller n=1 Tax=Gemmatimonas groenlandica TaxID=2732249 RepID=A0A6M4ITN7_9BACT|nr:hypothetical protein [Gemmatimonas groenlandica]QJR37575.1 hypothetical protein HKW67_19665 [Gemmatimonas groenlandica]